MQTFRLTQTFAFLPQAETNHPAIKAWYKRTDRKNYSAQIAKIERRRARFRRMKANMAESIARCNPTLTTDTITDEAGVMASESSHFQIGHSSKIFFQMSVDFVHPPNMTKDPTIEVRSAAPNPNSGTLNSCIIQSFIPKLKIHLLPRILNRLNSPSCSPQAGEGVGGDWTSITLHNDRIYAHQLMRISYTTYDIRREDDVVRLKADPNVMVLEDSLTRQRPSDAENLSSAPPYRYARVLGICHADVRFVGALHDGRRDYTPHRLEFLWVRWYISLGYPGLESLELERLQLAPLESPDAIGFISPRAVVRGVHLIPNFKAGQLAKDNSPSQVVSPLHGKSASWSTYYLNRFVVLTHCSLMSYN
jgi:hypothetical protein